MPIRLGGRKTRKRPRSFTSFWAGGKIRPRAFVSTRSLGGRKTSPSRGLLPLPQISLLLVGDGF